MPNSYNTIRNRDRRPGLIDDRALSTWLPASISDLKLWLAAYKETGFSDDDPVSTWSDQSGNNKNATSSLTKRPLYKTNILNGQPVMRFDGSNDDMVITGLSEGNNITIFFVVIPSSTTPVGIWDSGSGQPNVLRNYAAGNLEWHSQAPWFSLGLADASAVILTAVCTLAPARGIYYYKNGTYVDAYSSASTTGMTWLNPRIGSVNSGSAGYYTGDMAEIILYSRALTTAELAQAHGYLQLKYGL